METGGRGGGRSDDVPRGDRKADLEGHELGSVAPEAGNAVREASSRLFPPFLGEGERRARTRCWPGARAGAGGRFPELPAFPGDPGAQGKTPRPREDSKGATYGLVLKSGRPRGQVIGADRDPSRGCASRRRSGTPALLTPFTPESNRPGLQQLPISGTCPVHSLVFFFGLAFTQPQ